MRKPLLFVLAPLVFVGASLAGAQPLPVTELFPVEPAANAGRGFAVAVDGEWLAMGAHQDDEMKRDAGAVYLFKWSGTTWDWKAKLFADPPQERAHLGFALAMRDGVLAAGAPGERTVYLFVREGDVWRQAEKTLTGPPRSVRRFGGSVAFGGGRLAVGAVDPHGTTPGAVHLFAAAPPWDRQEVIRPRRPQAGERFGQSVSLSEDLLVVGAPGYDLEPPGQGPDAGRVYVFERQNEVWKETGLPLSGEKDGQQLGLAVATDGSEIFAGAPTAEDDADPEDVNSGAVYRFVRSGEHWVGQGRLEVGDVDRGDQLGASLAMGDGLLVAGAPAPPPETRTGRVHVFRKTGTSWSKVRIPGAANSEIRDLASFAVAADGGRVALGGVLGDQGAGAAGAAWSFRCPSVHSEEQDCTEEAEVVARDPLQGKSFGFSVAIAGGHLAVGAVLRIPLHPFDEELYVSAGAVYVYRTAGSGWRQEARLASGDPLDGFGASIALHGERLVVGAPQGQIPPNFPFAGTRAGLVHLFSRQGDSWKTERRLFPEPPVLTQPFGSSVAVERDVVVIGAQQDSDPGAVYVAEKSGDSWLRTGKFLSGLATSRFGASISFRDNILAIGAPGEDEGIGAVYLAARGPGGWKTRKEPGNPRGPAYSADSGFGSSVAVEGGLLAVGVPELGIVRLEDEGGTSRGQPILTPGDHTVQSFGTSLSLFGSQLAVGAPEPGEEGRAFLFDTESGDSREFRPLQPLPNDEFGAAVALSERFLVVTSPGSARGDRVTVFAFPHPEAGDP